MYRARRYLKNPARVFLVLDQAANLLIRKESFSGFTHEMSQKVRQLFRMSKAYVTGRYRGIPHWQALLVLAGIIYFVSPVDLIPDTFPILGFLDDLSVFSWILSTLSDELQAFRKWEEAH